LTIACGPGITKALLFLPFSIEDLGAAGAWDGDAGVDIFSSFFLCGEGALGATGIEKGAEFFFSRTESSGRLMGAAGGAIGIASSLY